jgi:hypothetical protein
MIVSCLAANGAVICSPKKSSTDCKAHWDICEMCYIRTPIIILLLLLYYYISDKKNKIKFRKIRRRRRRRRTEEEKA